MNRNLIIVRAGDDSLHPGWLTPVVVPKPFDLMVSYYGDCKNRYADEADFYSTEKGGKFPPLGRLLRDRWDLISAYDCIAFPDDDLAGSLPAWSTAFGMFHAYNLDLAQPALTRDSPTIWPFTRQESGTDVRLTNFVEIMTPMFSRRALARVRGTFAESASGWGLDQVWPVLLPFPVFRMGIIDAAALVHTREPQSGSLYRDFQASGINPGEDDRRLRRKYGVPPMSYVEHARLPSH